MTTEICLNHNDPTVQMWFNLVGEEETYRQALLNGGILPKEPVMTLKDVRQYLDRFIPSSEFKYANIKSILSQVPLGTQAAFWRDTFYFKDAVSRGEANEELFHSVVSTILSPQERQQLYTEGAKLINVKSEVKRLSEKYPQTYDILSDTEKQERVIEEHLASMFVDSFKNPSLLEKFSKFIQNVFNTIKDFFGFATNRDYIETVFDNIKSGKYRNSNIIYSENATPSTYIIKGRNSLGITEFLGEAESEQILRNLRAIYFDLKQSNEMNHKELINETFNIARTYYDVYDKRVVGAFQESEEEYNDITKTNDKVVSQDYLELVSELELRIQEVAPFMFDLIEENQGDEITDENNDSEYQNLGDLTRDATESGFDNLSGWLKMYISTVGTRVPIQIGDRVVNFIEAVDQNRIYYGVARALNNSKNDFERLIKLIEFGNMESNPAARAFMIKVLTDSTGKNDLSVIDSIQNDYLNNYLITRDASIINKHIHPSRAYILQNVLKGFDLWSRTNLFQTVSPEVGVTRTFDANVNNAVNNQLAKWQTQYNSISRNEDLLDGMITKLEAGELFYTNLESAVDTNEAILFSALGINVSRDALRWLLINNTKNPDLVAADTIRYNAFLDQIKTYGSLKDIAGLLDNLQSYSKSSDIFEDNGIKGRLTLLAKINAIFDESVFESSYRTADGKTKYGFQWKTFDLEFINNLQDERFLDSLMNNGIVSYRIDDKGNPVYLSEANDFIQNNRFLKEMFELKNGKYQLVESKMKSLLPYMKLVAIDGMRQVESGTDRESEYANDQLNKALSKGDRAGIAKWQEEVLRLESVEGREGDGVTFTKMVTKDFDLLRLNFVVNNVTKVEGQILYPHYLGNLEAKRTADFVYLPELSGVANSTGLTKEGINLLKEEIRKEYDRIRRVHKEIAEMVSKNETAFVPNEYGEIKITSQKMRDLTGKDVYEKYHTGIVIKDGDVYRGKGIRALEFTDSILGVLPKEFMKTSLVEAALNDAPLEDVWKVQNLDKMINDHWTNTIFNIHLQQLNDNQIIPNLDKQWKKNGELNTDKFNNYVLSSFINVISFNQMIHGDPALVYKNDGADMYKRFGGRNAAIQSSETYLINPQLGINEVKDNMRYVVGQEFVSKNAYDPYELDDKGQPKLDERGNIVYNTIDQADAQNYSTTKYKRYLLWSRGKLTNSLAGALDRIELGLPLTAKQQQLMVDNAEFLNVDKTVAFNGVQYLKKSDFMLTKEFTSILTLEAEQALRMLDEGSEEARKILMDENNWVARPDVKFHHELRQNMEGWRRLPDNTLEKDSNKEYDLYMPMSASKMLNINVFDPSTGWNNIDGSIVQIAAKNYGLQLENPAGKKRIIDPSQMIEIIFNEQADNVSVNYKGENRKISDLESLYQQFLTDRDNSMFDLAYNELFDDNGDFDAENFFPKAVRSLINSGADPQTIKIFQSIENGKPQYNPNIGITKDKFINLLFAHITKGVLQQKVAGDAVAHVSSYGIKPVKQIRKIKIGDRFDYTWDVVKRDTDDYKAVARGTIKVANFDLENTVKDSVIYDPTLETDALREELKRLYESGEHYFTDELRHLKPRYQYDAKQANTEYSVVVGKPIAYYSETLMPSSRIDEKISSSNRYSFGVRIPSQDKHSAVNIEWIDQLPIYYGNTAITTKEIVALSGSDFDIDKLFIHKTEMYKKGNNWVAYGAGDKWEEYLEFLKDTNPRFKEKYYTTIQNAKARDQQLDNAYNELRDYHRNLIETRAAKSDIEYVEKYIKDIEQEYRDAYDKIEAFKKQPIDLLKELRLPTNAEVFKNPYVINNEILELKQIALTNDGTLLSRNGREAIYKTSATMDALKKLDKGKQYIGTNGQSIFAQNDVLPNHIFAKHSIVHKKNSVGKQNINPYVNGNLALIFAIRAGLKINDDFQLNINGKTSTGFGYIDQEGKRVFDILSTLISAATDEAKEQLNAKYNLSLDGAALAKTLVSLGYSLETAILYVNQPFIQMYLDMKNQRNSTIYLDKVNISDDNIINHILSLQGEVQEKVGYTNEELLENIKTGGYNNSLNVAVINDLSKVQKINSQLSMLTRFMKVKKGFTDGIEQLDDLNLAVELLGVNLTDKKEIYKFNKNNPLATAGLLKNKKIPQVINVVRNILPKVNLMSNKLILSRNPDIMSIKETIFNSLRGVSIEDKQFLEKEIDTYIYTRLYMSQNGVNTSILTNNLFNRGEDHSTVGQTFENLKQEINRVKREGIKTQDDALFLELDGTSILKRLTVKVSSDKSEVLKLDTFAKLSAEQQDTLITSFGSMIKTLSYLSDAYPQYKNLPQQMFAYWVVKDGFQSKFGSIAKLFPMYMFKTHSNSIDEALEGKSESLKEARRILVGPKDILKRIAQNSNTRKYLKNFYTPVSPTSKKYHKTGGKYIWNIGELRREVKDGKQESLMASLNYPFEVEKDGSIHSFPLYLKANETGEDKKKRSVPLELSAVQFIDGSGMNNTNPSFYRDLRERADEIEFIQYKYVQGQNNISNQSIMTIDTNYSNLPDVEKETEIDEDYDGAEDEGCSILPF